VAAHDYRRAYGTTITCVRSDNVTGPDKKFAHDHVNRMCQPARKVRHLPRHHALRHPRRGHGGGIRARGCRPWTSPKHTTLQFRGITLSIGELAALVREFLPKKPKIRFEAETGGRRHSATS
jgi:hypothetical protein